MAVVVVGLTEEQETEAVDKSTLRPARATGRAGRGGRGGGRRTVVVVNAATPGADAVARRGATPILWAGLPGQEGGHAVAAALLDEIEPAGRLVTTFPVADGASPAWEVIPTDGALAYDEGTYIGYRGHAAGRAPEPAFWFGHGLGYGDLVTTGRRPSPDGDPSSVEVTNTGGRRLAGRSCRSTSIRSATTSRCAWSGGPAVDVRGRRSRSPRRSTVTERMWRTWDTGTASWQSLDGGELLVARGLGDVRVRLPDAP